MLRWTIKVFYYYYSSDHTRLNSSLTMVFHPPSIQSPVNLLIFTQGCRKCCCCLVSTTVPCIRRPCVNRSDNSMFTKWPHSCHDAFCLALNENSCESSKMHPILYSFGPISYKSIPNWAELLYTRLMADLRLWYVADLCCFDIDRNTNPFDTVFNICKCNLYPRSSDHFTNITQLEIAARPPVCT